MANTLTREEALTLLYAADRLRAAAILPTLTRQEREDKLVNLLENDDLPITTPDDDPEDIALGIYREANGEYRLVRPEMPDDVENPRYDKLILQLLPDDGNYRGVTNHYLSERLARIGHADITVIGEPEMLAPCPCCGYRTLTHPGEYDICPVCFWEDAGIWDPNQYVGPNHMTLGEGRRNYQAIGACDQGSLDFVDSTPGKYVREFAFGQN